MSSENLRRKTRKSRTVVEDDEGFHQTLRTFTVNEHRTRLTVHAAGGQVRIFLGDPEWLDGSGVGLTRDQALALSEKIRRAAEEVDAGD